MRQQFEEVEKKIEDFMEENEIDLDEIDDPEFEPIKKHIKFVENNPLDATAEQYCKKALRFLENTFYKKAGKKSKLNYDFETISWYHTLLPVKLHRALCGFHEPACEDDFSMHDAVAQFAICKKAIKESINALKKLKPYCPEPKGLIVELLALLHNIHSRIVAMEEDIQ